jgi:hypothetical protein
MADAKFEDGAEKPLRLIGRDADDVGVISACLQDAVFTGDQIHWDAKKRRLALLLNRFRWEDPARRTERVQAVLRIDDVLRVQSTGVTRDVDVVLSVLSLAWTPGAEGAGRLELVLAGDGAIGVDVECLEMSVADVSKPYVAPSGKRPTHPE